MNLGTEVNHYIIRTRFLLAATLVGTIALGGCGGTKLWGKDDKSSQAQQVVPKETLREQAVRAAEPVWEIKDRGSWMGRVAGVLISGEEDADTATAAFDMSGQEGKTAELALEYLESLEENNQGIDELAARVSRDATKRTLR